MDETYWESAEDFRWITPAFREAAIAIYGCSCNACCTALNLETGFERRAKEKEKGHADLSST